MACQSPFWPFRVCLASGAVLVWAIGPLEHPGLLVGFAWPVNPGSCWAVGAPRRPRPIPGLPPAPLKGFALLIRTHSSPHKLTPQGSPLFDLIHTRILSKFQLAVFIIGTVSKFFSMKQILFSRNGKSPKDPWMLKLSKFWSYAAQNLAKLVEKLAIAW